MLPRLSLGRKTTARRRGVWFFVISFVAICLFAFAPVISILVASGIAAQNDCVLHEGFANPCIIDGEDWGETIYALGVAGWLMLVTIPLGLIFFAGWAIALITALLRLHRERHKV